MHRLNGISAGCPRICHKKKKPFPGRSRALSQPRHNTSNHNRLSYKPSTGFALWAIDQRRQFRTANPPSVENSDKQPNSRRIKRMWSMLSNATKNHWRRKLRNAAGGDPASSVTYDGDAIPSRNGVVKKDEDTTSSSSLPSNDAMMFAKCTPSNAAAHLLLLGESLQTMGESLNSFEGQVSIAGTLSVLLDSFLCSMGPLMALTKEIPHIEENPHLDAALNSTLDNIAYILPGLEL